MPLHLVLGSPIVRYMAVKHTFLLLPLWILMINMSFLDHNFQILRNRGVIVIISMVCFPMLHEDTMQYVTGMAIERVGAYGRFY